MGGGDLNMKKSWHPLLIKNQERVWKEEQKAAEEQKNLDQLKKELEEERQLQELRRMQEAAGGKKRQERLDWMYAAGPNQSSSGKAQEMEEYLLGKKRVDSLVQQGNTLSELSADSKDIFINAMNPNANTYRDTQSKVREDPLLMIKKIEQDNIKAIVTNPIKMKELREKTKSKKKHKKEKKDKSKHAKDRSISPSEKKRKRHRDDYDRERNDHDREHNVSPYSKNAKERSISPSEKKRKRYRDDYDWERDDHDRERSASPYRKRSRRDFVSPQRKKEYRDYDSLSRDNGYRRSSRSPLNGWDRNKPRHNRFDRRPSMSPVRRNGDDSRKKTSKENAEKRLKEMMEDARKLEEERKTRVITQVAKEQEEEKNIAAQLAKGHSSHLRNLYRETYLSSHQMDLEGQVRKSRNMLLKVED